MFQGRITEKTASVVTLVQLKTSARGESECSVFVRVAKEGVMAGTQHTSNMTRNMVREMAMSCLVSVSRNIYPTFGASLS